MREKNALAKLAEYLVRLGEGDTLKHITSEIVFLDKHNWDVEAALKDISSGFPVMPKSQFNKASFCQGIDQENPDIYEGIYEGFFDKSDALNSSVQLTSDGPP